MPNYELARIDKSDGKATRFSVNTLTGEVSEDYHEFNETARNALLKLIELEGQEPKPELASRFEIIGYNGTEYFVNIISITPDIKPGT